MEIDGGDFVPGDWQETGPNLVDLINSTELAGGEFHASLALSQERAREQFKAGVALPYLILAESMPAAVGRRGSKWWVGAGSLSMSLIWQGNESQEPSPHKGGILSLATALAVINATETATNGELIPGRDLTLHWPNDVYLRGRKLSGILLEHLPENTFAIGIGINVNNRTAAAPQDLQAKITTLRDEIGFALPRVEFLRLFLQGFFANAELSKTPLGRKQIVDRATNLCIQVGRTTNVHIGEKTVSGSCVGIDLTGGLVLDTDAGQQVFHSGEISTTEMP